MDRVMVGRGIFPHQVHRHPVLLSRFAVQRQPFTSCSQEANRREIERSYGGRVRDLVGRISEEHLASLGPQELTVLRVLAEAEGRVVSRTELARQAGLARASQRRCDAVLVAVRRALGPDVVRNVRGRGWPLVFPAESIVRP